MDREFGGCRCADEDKMADLVTNTKASDRKRTEDVVGHALNGVMFDQRNMLVGGGMIDVARSPAGDDLIDALFVLNRP